MQKESKKTSQIELIKVENTKETQAKIEHEEKLPDIDAKNFKEFLVKAKKLSQKLDHDEAIKAIQHLLQSAIKHYKNETSLQLAPFYFEYGNILLTKIEQEVEIFSETNSLGESMNDPEKQQEIIKKMSVALIEQLAKTPIDIKSLGIDQKEPLPKEKIEKQEKKVQEEEKVEETVNKKVDVQPKEEEEKVEEIVQKIPVDKVKEEPVKQMKEEKIEQVSEEKVELEEEPSEIQIAYESMEVAKSIVERHILKLLKDTPNDKSSITNYKNNFCKILTRLGDLECQQNKFNEALILYRKCQKSRLETEDPKTSRSIAEIHFLIGNCLLYQNAKHCEENALQEFEAAKTILLTNLKNSKVEEEVAEIKQILEEFQNKIDDTKIQLDEREEFQKVKQDHLELALNSNQKEFKEQKTFIEKENQDVKDLGTFGYKKGKRSRELAGLQNVEENSSVNTSKPEKLEDEVVTKRNSSGHKEKVIKQK